MSNPLCFKGDKKWCSCNKMLKFWGTNFQKTIDVVVLHHGILCRPLNFLEWFAWRKYRLLEADMQKQQLGNQLHCHVRRTTWGLKLNLLEARTTTAREVMGAKENLKGPWRKPRMDLGGSSRAGLATLPGVLPSFYHQCSTHKSQEASMEKAQ